MKEAAVAVIWVGHIKMQKCGCTVELQEELLAD